jgi:hypothetical protein
VPGVAVCTDSDGVIVLVVKLGVTLTVTVEYAATSIFVPLLEIVFVPVGIKYSLGIGPTLTSPKVYLPEATAVCVAVVGVIVVAVYVDKVVEVDLVPALT